MTPQNATHPQHRAGDLKRAYVAIEAYATCDAAGVDAVLAEADQLDRRDDLVWTLLFMLTRLTHLDRNPERLVSIRADIAHFARAEAGSVPPPIGFDSDGGAAQG
ncbi:hypothetical protein H7I53_23080 [Mycolicibacterium pulveris]|uniref:Uncharacterized protein n=1 Tax=Mycolicibacterium pulveris TaxID=36813 RepID=A0A7I7UNF4_MYCPV|nr:hypothetical protein [Mycolicibacterium pulveris]MCV6983091.1 hypothetical protein [Mycolicibacterium pulveris]BBY82955.1 hypothetical protein MPUL_41130 [Mycolicibacterium pulveris]